MNPPSAPPLLLRALVPALLVVLWIAVFGAGGASFGRIGDVATEDRASFLPASAESTAVQDRIAEFTGSDAVPAILVIERDGGLEDADLTALEDLAGDAGDVVPGATASPVIPAEDGEAAQVVVSIPSGQDAGEAVEALEADLEDLPPGLGAWVSGPAGFTADLQAAFAGIDGILLVVALAVVLLIVVIVYRSPLLPLLVLLSSMTALCAAILLNVSLAEAGLVTINGQVQGILFILVIGAATDYSLLFVTRFREELRDHASDPLLSRARGTLPALGPNLRGATLVSRKLMSESSECAEAESPSYPLEAPLNERVEAPIRGLPHAVSCCPQALKFGRERPRECAVSQRGGGVS